MSLIYIVEGGFVLWALCLGTAISAAVYGLYRAAREDDNW